jgi:hypothetical protein
MESFEIFCSSRSVIRMINSRRMRWARHVARRRGRNAYRVLVGTPVGKRLLWRTRRRWEDNIKIDLKEMGWECVDRIYLAQARGKWRLFRTWQWTFGYHTMRGICWLAGKLSVFKETLPYGVSVRCNNFWLCFALVPVIGAMYAWPEAYCLKLRNEFWWNLVLADGCTASFMLFRPGMVQPVP